MVVPAVSIAKNELLIRAFLNKDRKTLLELCKPLFEEMKKHGIKQFQFNQKELVTFLRIHNPEQYGEDLSIYRPAVVKSIKGNETVHGLEQGKSGYGFRAIIPLIFESNVIGAIELGGAFDEHFLKKLNDHFQGKWYVYNLARGVSLDSNKFLITYFGETNSNEIKKQNVLPEEYTYEKLREDNHIYFKSKETEEISLYIPIRNYNDDVVLFIKYIFPTDYYKRINNLIFASITVGFFGLLLSGVIIIILYRQITIPINGLVLEAEKIKNFDLNDSIQIKTNVNEIQNLVLSFINMKKGLQSFKKYVPAQLVRDLIQTNEEANIGGKRRDLTVFFSDIANFTNISEDLTPKELTSQLSEYLNVVSEIIIKHNGTIDKYIGDSVMSFWGAPIELKDHAESACIAALEIQKVCKELNKKWGQEEKPKFKTRIGLNSGDIIVGNVGSNQRLNYTVIGDSVNLASRLESLCKYYGTEIMISGFTQELVKNSFETRIIDRVVVKGKTDPVAIYELIAEKGDISTNDLEDLHYFNDAVHFYTIREWDLALALLEKLSLKNKFRLTVDMYISRCNEFKKNPPPSNWQGVVTMRDK
jgi:adenylate cyclase